MTWRRGQPQITKDDFLELARFLMKMDAKLDDILDELEIEHGED